jgi:hypothetical protein
VPSGNTDGPLTMAPASLGACERLLFRSITGGHFPGLRREWVFLIPAFFHSFSFCRAPETRNAETNRRPEQRRRPELAPQSTLSPSPMTEVSDAISH